MTTCRVLRCSQPTDDTYYVERFGELYPFAVCSEHYRHLDGGGDWRLMPIDPEGHHMELLCDPEDLAGDGVLLMIGDDGGLESGVATWTSRREYVAALTLDAALWGQEGNPSQVRILLTRAQALHLASELGAVDIYAPEDEV